MAPQFEANNYGAPKPNVMDSWNTRGGALTQGVQSPKLPQLGDSAGGFGGGMNAPQAPSELSLAPDGMLVPGAGPQLPGGGGGPGLAGAWTKYGDMATGVANIGLGVWNAMETSKMNKFMKGYYGDQTALQKADFANAAQDANYRLENRERSRNSARGIAYDSPEMKQNLAASMDKWGAQERI